MMTIMSFFLFVIKYWYTFHYGGLYACECVRLFYGCSSLWTSDQCLRYLGMCNGLYANKNVKQMICLIRRANYINVICALMISYFAIGCPVLFGT